MYYAFIDTNIFIRMMSQGKPGCEAELLDRLKALVAGGILTLLVPEVVRLEIECQMARLSEDLRLAYGKLKKSINETPDLWNEIADAQLSLMRTTDNLREEKSHSWQEVHARVIELLDRPEVSSIPFSPEIMCRSKKRIIRGGMPDISQSADQDAAIIESLVIHFSGISDPDPILLFCSENHKHFAIEVLPKGDLSRRFAMHPLLAEGLPKAVHFSTQLQDLLWLDQGYESLPKRPDDEEVRGAMERYEALGKEVDYDLDQEEYYEAWMLVEKLGDSRYASEFTERIVPTLPDDVRARRGILVNSIQSLLGECRLCKSWNDRSELKLASWMEYVPEHMVPYTSLSNLLIIEKNLHRYLIVHKEMVL